ncbi:MAG: UbiX family flavin prenyltransferase [Bacteroidetes bacterium]|nr:UbiX family flavin prenyltransferase [Bacteroidota bacterium]
MKRVVVAITGASGSIYAQRLITKLLKINDQWSNLALVLSDNAHQVWTEEIGPVNFNDWGIPIFDKRDFNAPFASGSGKYDTMVIIPCSMGTLARVATGVSNDLITRAADVILKERRKLICVVREAPYNLVHIKNMETLTLAGGVICPATPSFYSKPTSIEQVVDTVVDRVLDLAGFDVASFRWGSNA